MGWLHGDPQPRHVRLVEDTRAPGAAPAPPYPVPKSIKSRGSTAAAQTASKLHDSDRRPLVVKILDYNMARPMCDPREGQAELELLVENCGFSQALLWA